ncbi:hypothetical protein DFH27DRAFT_609472 [Peziza echinospora]|nr:hypothetical protein DFH27DRAFT_609472 [Peziza echinospora]
MSNCLLSSNPRLKRSRRNRNIILIALLMFLSISMVATKPLVHEALVYRRAARAARAAAAMAAEIDQSIKAITDTTNTTNTTTENIGGGKSTFLPRSASPIFRNQNNDEKLQLSTQEGKRNLAEEIDVDDLVASLESINIHPSPSNVLVVQRSGGEGKMIRVGKMRVERD